MITKAKDVVKINLLVPILVILFVLSILSAQPTHKANLPNKYKEDDTTTFFQKLVAPYKNAPKFYKK